MLLLFCALLVLAYPTQPGCISDVTSMCSGMCSNAAATNTYTVALNKTVSWTNGEKIKLDISGGSFIGWYAFMTKSTSTSARRGTWTDVTNGGAFSCSGSANSVGQTSEATKTSASAVWNAPADGDYTLQYNVMIVKSRTSSGTCDWTYAKGTINANATNIVEATPAPTPASAAVRAQSSPTLTTLALTLLVASVALLAVSFQ